MRNLLYIIYSLLAISLGYIDIWGGEVQYLMLSGLLLIFVASELLSIYLSKMPYYFISPIFLGGVVTFGLSLGGLSNLLFPIEAKEYVDPILYEPRWQSIGMANVCFAAMFTFIGYRSKIGPKIFNFIMYNMSYWKLYSGRVIVSRLIIVAILAYLIKLYLFSIGLYGRSVDSRFFEAVSGYKLGSQIRVLAPLSLLTFTIITYLYIKHKNQLYAWLFYVSLALEIFFAFLYGARGPFLIPFLIIFVVDYYIKQKFKLGYLALGMLPLYLAFTFVYEYKNFSLSPQFVKKSNPIEMFNDFLDFRKNLTEVNLKGLRGESVTGSILASTSMAPEGCMAVWYKEVHGLDSEDPNFIKHILTVPFDTFFPKFLQKRNEPAWGYWFKNKVLGHTIELKYSIAMNPMGFLYLAGGSFMVCFGFFIYGILLNLNYQYLSWGIIGFISFSATLSVLYNFDSVFSGTLVTVLRELIIFPVFYFLLLCRWQQK